MSQLTGLEAVELTDCEHLEMPEWIWSLQALRELTLDSLANYNGFQPVELPAMSALTWLTSLSLGYWNIQRLPASIGDLTGLQALQLDGLHALIEVPSIEALTALRTLVPIFQVPDSGTVMDTLQPVKIDSSRLYPEPCRRSGASGLSKWRSSQWMWKYLDGRAGLRSCGLSGHGRRCTCPKVSVAVAK